MKTELKKPAIEVVPNLAGAVQNALLEAEEHHIAAWSRNLETRQRFGADLISALRSMVDSQVVVIDGATVHDLDGFCRQLEVQMPLATAGVAMAPGLRRGHEPVRRSINEAGGVLDRVRERPQDELSPSHLKRRYYVWHNADVLLKGDPKLFGALVDCIAGAAAEAEYASEDLLLIHRLVMIGGPELHTYGNRKEGQFHSWLREGDGREPGSPPFWAVVSGLSKPPVSVVEIRPVS